MGCAKLAVEVFLLGAVCLRPTEFLLTMQTFSGHIAQQQFPSSQRKKKFLPIIERTVPKQSATSRDLTLRDRHSLHFFKSKCSLIPSCLLLASRRERERETKNHQKCFLTVVCSKKHAQLFHTDETSKCRRFQEPSMAASDARGRPGNGPPLVITGSVRHASLQSNWNINL
jgi:hypothetical protein